jgi:glycosyltransferase involved in cell wall biosynthesis
LHIVTQATVGGATLGTLEAAFGLREHFEVHVACGEVTDPDHALISRAMRELPFHVVPELGREIHPVNDVRGLRALGRLISGIRPDVVHTHSSKAGVLGRETAARIGIPAVHSVHGWGHTPLDSAFRRRLLVLAERWAATRCHLIAAVSRDVRDEGLHLNIGRPEQYRIVPEWVDLEPSYADHAAGRHAARKVLGLTSEVPVIGWVGRFVAQKDPRTLGQVLVRTLRGDLSAVAVLIGDGPDMELVRRTTEEGGCGEQVKFLGLCDDVRRLLPAFDVVVHTSRWEGHPRVVQEAIAERVPVVTAQVSGVRDILLDDRVGRAVPSGDADAFAAACGHYLAHRERYVPIDEDAIAAVARTNGVAASMRAHLDVYDELLDAGGPVEAAGRAGRDQPGRRAER